VYLGRGIAAILIALAAAVMMRVATHGVAALHCLLGWSRSNTLKAIRRRESDGQCQRNAFSGVSHE
jgi:hypothetical protein